MPDGEMFHHSKSSLLEDFKSLLALVRIAAIVTSWLLRLPWGVGDVAGWLVVAGARVGSWTAVTAYASLMRCCAAESGSIGKEVSLVISERATTRTIVGCVLVGERNAVVASGAGTEW